MDKIDTAAIEAVKDIVVAFMAQRAVDASELAALVREVRDALTGTEPMAVTSLPAASATAAVASPATARAAPQPTPAVPVDKSITDEFLISLEDGRRYRSLRRHLMAKYQMTPEQYREKWNLPSDYPMVAPSYARDRSDVAKRIGLGKKPGAASGSTKRSGVAVAAKGRSRRA